MFDKPTKKGKFVPFFLLTKQIKVWYNIQVEKYAHIVIV